MNEIFQILRPGGWIECCEFRGLHFYSENKKLPEKSALQRGTESPRFLVNAVLFIPG